MCLLDIKFFVPLLKIERKNPTHLLIQIYSLLVIKKDMISQYWTLLKK